MRKRQSDKRRIEKTDVGSKMRAYKREEKPMKRAAAAKLLCKEQMILLAAIALFGSGFAGVAAYYEFIERTYGLYALIATLLVIFAILTASAIFFGFAIRIDELSRTTRKDNNGDRKGYIKRLWDRLFSDASLHSSVDVLESVPQKRNKNGKPRTNRTHSAKQKRAKGDTKSPRRRV
jgi:hypothetical protein